MRPMNRETELRLRVRLAKAEREARCQRRRADKATAEAAVLRIESSRLVRAMAYCLRDDSESRKILDAMRTLGIKVEEGT